MLCTPSDMEPMSKILWRFVYFFIIVFGQFYFVTFSSFLGVGFFDGVY